MQTENTNGVISFLDGGGPVYEIVDVQPWRKDFTSSLAHKLAMEISSVQQLFPRLAAAPADSGASQEVSPPSPGVVASQQSPPGVSHGLRLQSVAAPQKVAAKDPTGGAMEKLSAEISACNASLQSMQDGLYQLNSDTVILNSIQKSLKGAATGIVGDIRQLLSSLSPSTTVTPKTDAALSKLSSVGDISTMGGGGDSNPAIAELMGLQKEMARLQQERETLQGSLAKAEAEAKTARALDSKNQKREQAALASRMSDMGALLPEPNASTPVTGGKAAAAPVEMGFLLGNMSRIITQVLGDGPMGRAELEKAAEFKRWSRSLIGPVDIAHMNDPLGKTGSVGTRKVRLHARSARALSLRAQFVASVATRTRARATAILAAVNGSAGVGAAGVGAITPAAGNGTAVSAVRKQLSEARSLASQASMLEALSSILSSNAKEQLAEAGHTLSMIMPAPPTIKGENKAQVPEPTSTYHRDLLGALFRARMDLGLIKPLSAVTGNSTAKGTSPNGTTSGEEGWNDSGSGNGSGSGSGSSLGDGGAEPGADCLEMGSVYSDLETQEQVDSLILGLSDNEANSEAGKGVSAYLSHGNAALKRKRCPPKEKRRAVGSSGSGSGSGSGSEVGKEEEDDESEAEEEPTESALAGNSTAAAAEEAEEQALALNATSKAGRSAQEHLQALGWARGNASQASRRLTLHLSANDSLPHRLGDGYAASLTDSGKARAAMEAGATIADAIQQAGAAADQRLRSELSLNYTYSNTLHTRSSSMLGLSAAAPFGAEVKQQTPTTPDTHGCVTEAGEAWCQPLRRCVLPWKQACPVSADWSAMAKLRKLALAVQRNREAQMTAAGLYSNTVSGQFHRAPSAPPAAAVNNGTVNAAVVPVIRSTVGDGGDQDENAGGAEIVTALLELPPSGARKLTDGKNTSAVNSSVVTSLRSAYYLARELVRITHNDSSTSPVLAEVAKRMRQLGVTPGPQPHRVLGWQDELAQLRSQHVAGATKRSKARAFHGRLRSEATASNAQDAAEALTRLASRLRKAERELSVRKAVSLPQVDIDFSAKKVALLKQELAGAESTASDYVSRVAAAAREHEEADAHLEVVKRAAAIMGSDQVLPKDTPAMIELKLAKIKAAEISEELEEIMAEVRRAKDAEHSIATALNKSVTSAATARGHLAKSSAALPGALQVQKVHPGAASTLLVTHLNSEVAKWGALNKGSTTAAVSAIADLRLARLRVAAKQNNGSIVQARLLSAQAEVAVASAGRNMETARQRLAGAKKTLQGVGAGDDFERSQAQSDLDRATKANISAVSKAQSAAVNMEREAQATQALMGLLLRNQARLAASLREAKGSPADLGAAEAAIAKERKRQGFAPAANPFPKAGATAAVAPAGGAAKAAAAAGAASTTPAPSSSSKAASPPVATNSSGSISGGEAVAAVPTSNELPVEDTKLWNITSGSPGTRIYLAVKAVTKARDNVTRYKAQSKQAELDVVRAGLARTAAQDEVARAKLNSVAAGKAATLAQARFNEVEGSLSKAEAEGKALLASGGDATEAKALAAALLPQVEAAAKELTRAKAAQTAARQAEGTAILRTQQAVATVAAAETLVNSTTVDLNRAVQGLGKAEKLAVQLLAEEKAAQLLLSGNSSTSSAILSTGNNSSSNSTEDEEEPLSGGTPRYRMTLAEKREERAGLEVAATGKGAPTTTQDLDKAAAAAAAASAETPTLSAGVPPLKPILNAGVQGVSGDAWLKAPVWYITQFNKTFADAQRACAASDRKSMAAALSTGMIGQNLTMAAETAKVCSSQQLQQLQLQGYSNCACGWTSTRSTSNQSEALFQSAGEMDIAFPMATVLEGCGRPGINYCNWQERSGVYCCR